MPTEWSEGILLAELAEEPELSEELSAVVERVKTPPPGKIVPHVVLNFGGVEYLNSSHIAAMLRLRKRLAEAGRHLVLASVGDQLWSVLLLTGLDRVFVFAPDTMTALTRVCSLTATRGRKPDPSSPVEFHARPHGRQRAPWRGYPRSCRGELSQAPQPVKKTA